MRSVYPKFPQQTSRHSLRAQSQTTHRQPRYRQKLMPEQRWLPKPARHLLHPAVFVPQPGPQEPEDAEASAPHLAPPRIGCIQQPSPREGPAASEADTLSFDPSLTRCSRVKHLRMLTYGQRDVSSINPLATSRHDILPSTDSAKPPVYD